MAMSPMLVCVDTVAAIFEASGVALYATTSWVPSVSGSTLPVAIETRFRFALPFSAETTTSDAPSFGQRIGLRLPPRGAA